VGEGIESGSRMGFNVIIYDGDKADASPGENINESRLAWAPRSGVQGRPEDWGRIDLE
jgi:CelD/BcsL family acetyltransferase involved in cellulose biosynthesis